MIKNTKHSLQEIILDFNREIDLHPDFAEAYCSRGMIKLSLNDFGGAFMDWTTAIDLGCKNSFLLLKYFNYL